MADPTIEELERLLAAWVDSVPGTLGGTRAHTEYTRALLVAAPELCAQAKRAAELERDLAQREEHIAALETAGIGELLDRDVVAELERELDEEREKIGLLMQQPPGYDELRARLDFPWQMMRLWCLTRNREKHEHRGKVTTLEHKIDELEREKADLVDALVRCADLTTWVPVNEVDSRIRRIHRIINAALAGRGGKGDG